MNTKWARHFAAPHPLWRKRESKNGVWWEASPYYLWWAFLRENTNYRETCKRKGKGKCAELYKDFGDIYATDFKTWWTDGGRGARLFAEPPTPLDVAPLSKDDILNLPDGYDDNLIILPIDKRLPIRTVMSKVRQAFKKHGHLRSRGRQTLRQSQARYPLATNLNPRTLKLALDVYELRQANPDAYLWVIGQELNVSVKLTKEEWDLDKRSGVPLNLRLEIMKKKNALTVATRRHLRNAQSIIKWVGKGRFPVFTTTKAK